MAKHEVLLYGYIDSYSSAKFIEDVNEVEGDNLLVRVNTEGGSIEYGWGMVAKFDEFEGDKIVRVDGKAHSTGAMFVAYAKTVEVHDFSQIMIHRAALPSYIESNEEYFTSTMREYLENVNKSFRKVLEAKIDVKKFESMKGVSIKDIFSMEGRVEVILNAREAKQVGLVSKVISVKPEKRAEMMKMYDIAAHGSGLKNEENKEYNHENVTNMTIEELQAKHPAIFAQVVAMGVTKEADRTGSWMAFNSLDPKAVAEGIKSGDNMTETARSEFAVKQMSATALASLEGEASGSTDTETIPPKAEGSSGKEGKEGKEGEGGEPTELEALEVKMNAELGINTKTKK